MTLLSQDIVLQGIQNKAARKAVMVDLKPQKGYKTDKLEAVLNIVIANNPEDPSEGSGRFPD